MPQPGFLYARGDFNPFNSASTNYSGGATIMTKRFYSKPYKAGKRPRSKSKPKKPKKRTASIGEQKIAFLLDLHQVRYTREKKFPWLLGVKLGKMRLDFFLPDHNLAIEFDGIYHNRPKQKLNDAKKDTLLHQRQIKLLRIHYTQFKNIESILKNNLVI